MNIFSSSDFLTSRPGKKPKYPWEKLEIGQSFIADSTLASMKTYCSAKSKETGKRFRAVQHSDGTVEVGRIA